MFDALEKKWKDTDQGDLINKLYQGKLKDYVKCLEVRRHCKVYRYTLNSPGGHQKLGAPESFWCKPGGHQKVSGPSVVSKNIFTEIFQKLNCISKSYGVMFFFFYL